MGMRELPRIILWGSHLCCCVVCVSVVGLALVGEGVLTCGAASRPWQWGPGCPNQHWSNACVRSEDFKKYINPGELIVRICNSSLSSPFCDGKQTILSSTRPLSYQFLLVAKTGCLSLPSRWGGGRSTARGAFFV